MQFAVSDRSDTKAEGGDLAKDTHTVVYVALERQIICQYGLA